ncbi:MAG: hypothetical protein SVG88_03085 [Halobacteriales archaeon]|nr:hypothetical protein [Halobacteriales archaeon]
MVAKKAIIGGAEIVGAIGVVIATFSVSGFASDPLPWRILAIFMGAEGIEKLPLMDG